MTSDCLGWLVTGVHTDISACGTYHDYLANWVANNSFALTPNAAPFSQPFATGLTGLAAVVLASNSPPGPSSEPRL